MCILFVLIGILLIADSKGTADTVRKCIYVCLDSLIPSLYCFMTFATLLIKSNAGELIITPLWYIMRYILKLDKKTFAVFILSQLGGYPVGVKLLNELFARNSCHSNKYNKALLYCYNSGPAFVIGIVGIGIYGDITAGFIVFLSCLTANFLIAVMLNIRNDIGKTHKTEIRLSSSDISSTLTGTAKAMLNIALPILLFNCIAELADYVLSNITEIKIPDILKAITEITNIKSVGSVFSLPLTTALISFGGLCVIYQIFTLADFRIRKLNFIIARIIISAVSAFVCLLITAATGYQPVRNVFAYATDTLITDPLLLMCIAVMTFILLKDTGKTNKI